MDLSAFFGVLSTVDFALLGLWWVTVQARSDLREQTAAGGRMAYMVSLQFVVPGTAALLAQVAPDLSAVWRISFGVAGVAGVLSIVLISPALVAEGAASVARLLRFVALPLYAVLIAIALSAGAFQSNARFQPLQVEAVLFCMITFLSAQLAWAAAMTPDQKPATPDAVGEHLDLDVDRHYR